MESSITRGVEGEICFARTDNRIDTLSAIEVEGSRGTLIRFPAAGGGAITFRAAATALLAAEAVHEAVEGQAGTLVRLLGVGTRGRKRHPLDWLNVTERQPGFEGSRRNHEWYVIGKDGGLEVTFEHGVFGYRREQHQRWSSALARLAELLAGECSWEQFGDEESRNTLLGKGQFYWKRANAPFPGGDLVPVDNFVFRVPGQLDVRLSGVGHECAIEVTEHGTDGEVEWYADYAEGLQRMADVLAGRIDLGDFGKIGRPELYANVASTQPQATYMEPPMLKGQFFVEAIHRSDDIYPAPVLVFKTGEGQKAALHVTQTEWEVRLLGERDLWKIWTFPLESAADALRTLAQVLQGTLRWPQD